MLTIDLPTDVEDRLAKFAEEAGQSKNNFAEAVLLEHLDALQLGHGRDSELAAEDASVLRQKWREAVADDSEGLDPEPIFDRFERTYQAMAEGLPR